MSVKRSQSKDMSISVNRVCDQNHSLLGGLPGGGGRPSQILRDATRCRKPVRVQWRCATCHPINSQASPPINVIPAALPGPQDLLSSSYGGARQTLMVCKLVALDGTDQGASNAPGLREIRALGAKGQPSQGTPTTWGEATMSPHHESWLHINPHHFFYNTYTISRHITFVQHNKKS